MSSHPLLERSDMISYFYAKKNPATSPVKVKLEGEEVGTIKPVKSGWQYFPKKGKTNGKIFERLFLCQRKLEEKL